MNGTFKFRYNLTEIRVERFSINNNRLKVRFNEQRDSIEVSQDDIDFELRMKYRAVSIPPVMADAGSIRATKEDITFTSEVQIEPNEEGKPDIKIRNL